MSSIIACKNLKPNLIVTEIREVVFQPHRRVVGWNWHPLNILHNLIIYLELELYILIPSIIALVPKSECNVSWQLFFRGKDDSNIRPLDMETFLQTFTISDRKGHFLKSIVGH